MLENFRANVLVAAKASKADESNSKQVPHNKVLINLGCSTGMREYWPSVVSKRHIPQKGPHTWLVSGW